MPERAEHIHFVTGRLAEHALRQTLEQLAPQAGFTFTLEVLPITVAALMTPPWIARHMHVPPATSRVLIPGYCGGDLSGLTCAAGTTVDRGPRDLRQLPDFFGASGAVTHDVSAHSIEIVAEINHVPRLTQEEILQQARGLVAQGADVIDVGCEPGDPWLGVGDCVKSLRDIGCRVSIDSFHPQEVAWAVRAGAELVLSVNSTNRRAAADWGCEVVAIPDSLQLLDSLDETVAFLATRHVRFRLDAVLEPIGLGFAGSLWRYLDLRRSYPEAAMMMGVGNLTEMTDADSAAINVLLLGFCQEVGIRSVLTTQVINWARSSVRECAIARRLVHYAVRQRVPPKHVMHDLVILRDDKLAPFGTAQLDALASGIQDHNIRLFAEEGQIHALRSGRRLSDADPFALFERLTTEFADHLGPSHAFYLGFEMCKALTALTLSKEYRQDEALDWGYLTVAEDLHRLARRQGDKDAVEA
jgi:dihydropteroate synthase-like protein